MRKALITGVTGQDGSYLSELLLSKGYEVHGLIRKSSTFNTSRINHLYRDPHEESNNFHLHYGDITDGTGLSNLISRIEPDEIYNLAAQSHVKVSFEMPDYTGQVDALGTVRILESIRSINSQIKFYQASTSEMFGGSPPPQNEATPFYPKSPYAAAKLYSYWVTKNYREAYGIHATNGILFNHESPRRGETFVTRKITKGISEILKGTRSKIFLGNLESVRDWGYAKEYVESMWLMLQARESDDYVVATGKGATIRDFCEYSFKKVNLDWQKYIEIDSNYLRPTEVESLIGDASKIKNKLGWSPTFDWQMVADIMVDFDVNQ
jgi:GDPmannose 4,6-dehydratase